MGKLTEEQLWSKVKKLLGRTIWTIVQHRANTLVEIRANRLLFEYANGQIRKTQPTKEQIWRTYSYLMERCQVTHDDFDVIPGQLHRDKRVSRIILAILAQAVQEQIEPFKRNEGAGKSGIRLKKCAD